MSYIHTHTYMYHIVVSSTIHTHIVDDLLFVMTNSPYLPSRPSHQHHPINQTSDNTVATIY